MKRRSFLSRAAAAVSGAAALSSNMHAATPRPQFEKSVRLSVSQWSLNCLHFGKAREDWSTFSRLLETDPNAVIQGSLTPLDFPAFVRDTFSIYAVDYVNQMFLGKARDTAWLKTLRDRSVGEGIRNEVFMIDLAGNLGDADPANRREAVRRHKEWIDAAVALECRSARVNAHGTGTWEDQLAQASDSLAELVDHAAKYPIPILVENHGGCSSHPDWLLAVLDQVDSPLLGTMVDYDNFFWSEDVIWGSSRMYNRYLGVERLMPRCMSVSAKAHAFDHLGFETSIDFIRMAELVSSSGYKGFVSAEYEGDQLDEIEGTRKTLELLEKSFFAAHS